MRRLTPIRAGLALLGLVLALLGMGLPAQASNYVPISGAGSTWSQNAIDQWRRNVNQYGMQVNYQGTGSSDGRNQFRNGTVDFGVTEIPYGVRDQGVYDNPPTRKYGYMPIVAGGTSFMYNLKIAGKRVTNLRLSGPNIAKIFTGTISMWNDPALVKDNPGLALPARSIVPVVRSDGSGTTAQFTLWMSKQQRSTWDAYCADNGLSTPCGQTSNYPVKSGSSFVALAGSLGVSGYVAQTQSEGSITYVEYSYALNPGFPVVKVLNNAGYYTEPNAQNVAVALLKSSINDDQSSSQYLTQILDGVYNNTDPRTYPLSSYSYLIIPTAVEGAFNIDKGRTLGAFANYFLCEGQQQTPLLGYSPLPLNLVKAGLAQVQRIPGMASQTVDISKCNNPTFSADGTNTLATTAPQPPACDQQGPLQCGTGTGGAKQTTAVAPAAAGSGTGATGAMGTTGTTGTAGGTGSTGATGAALPGLTPGGAGATIDPDTGAPMVGGDPAGAAAGSVNAIPVAVSLGLGAGLSHTLFVLAGLLLLALVLLPPLLARRFARDADK